MCLWPYQSDFFGELRHATRKPSFSRRRPRPTTLGRALHPVGSPFLPDPYTKLQGGAPRHMTLEQESQRVTDSPALAGPRGRWVARVVRPIPRGEMTWDTAAMGRMQ